MYLDSGGKQRLKTSKSGVRCWLLRNGCKLQAGHIDLGATKCFSPGYFFVVSEPGLEMIHVCSVPRHYVVYLIEKKKKLFVFWKRYLKTYLRFFRSLRNSIGNRQEWSSLAVTTCAIIFILCRPVWELQTQYATQTVMQLRFLQRS